MIECYMGLGGNVGNSYAVINNALEELFLTEGIYHLTTSRPYITTPVSDIPQNSYVNGVCRFHTTLDVESLLTTMESIEKKLGKIPKQKNAPRIIDLDLLFYGKLFYQNQKWSIPHPRWMQRLFVLVPLAELCEAISVNDEHGNLQSYHLKTPLKQFKNLFLEEVFPMEREFIYEKIYTS